MSHPFQVEGSSARFASLGQAKRVLAGATLPVVLVHTPSGDRIRIERVRAGKVSHRFL